MVTVSVHIVKRIIKLIDIRLRKLQGLKKELARSSLDYAIKEMMPRVRNLSITVLGISSLDEKEGIDGDCDFLDYGSRIPREYLIRVNTDLSIKEFVCTIMHEMVHVKQWLKGEMRDYIGHPFTRSWKGKKINIQKVCYDNHPWEKEAHKLQETLTESFLSDYK